MSLRNFILSLSASFGVAWLAIVIIPYFKMRGLEPVDFAEGEGTNAVYIPKRAGRIADGAEVYAANGCYQCHTQLIRPTYAGNDMFRPDWGGLANDEDRGDTRRETNAFDFGGEDFAQIGVTRIGPDLSNVGRRVEAIYAKGIEPAQWLYAHLYNPRWQPGRRDSSCPSVRFMFEETEIKGNPADDALPFPVAEGMEITPKPEARALVSYLLSLKKDQPVPASLDFAPPKLEAPAAAPVAPAPAAADDAAAGQTPAAESPTEAAPEESTTGGTAVPAEAAGEVETQPEGGAPVPATETNPSEITPTEAAPAETAPAEPAPAAPSN